MEMVNQIPFIDERKQKMDVLGENDDPIHAYLSQTKIK